MVNNNSNDDYNNDNNYYYIHIHICNYRSLKYFKNACFIKNSRFIVNREILVTALGIYGLVQNETNAEGSEWETTVDVEVYIYMYIRHSN